MLELLPYNWEWRGVSTIYRNITASLGDVHHFAWRAQSAKHAAYESPDDARYGDWTHEECASTCDTALPAGLVELCCAASSAHSHALLTCAGICTQHDAEWCSQRGAFGVLRVASCSALL